MLVPMIPRRLSPSPVVTARFVALWIACGILSPWALQAQALQAQAVQAQLPAAQSSATVSQQPAPVQNPDHLFVSPLDSDPIRSPDQVSADPATADTEPAYARESIHKEGGVYLLHAEVDEVVLNATVLEGTRLVADLKKENFRVLEDGVPQRLIGFQHADIPVSIALVVDNSGSMSRKRPAVNKSTLDLIAASNADDEAFVVNFADEAFIDQDFTADVAKLRQGLAHMDTRGGTALFDAVVASADKLATDAKRPKQVIVLITDGEDNASALNLQQAIRRVQQLAGPVIYTIGLLFGDEMSRGEVRHARHALEMLSAETGGVAFFPKSIEQIDQIAAEVARDIRSQYTLGYHSTRPTSEPGFRRVTVEAHADGRAKMTVRTRTGYFPGPSGMQPVKLAHP